MKRLIQYTSPYEEIDFCRCSTKYEVLPYVVEDTAGSTELRNLSILLGFTPLGNAQTLKKGKGDYVKSLTITHSLAVGSSPRIDSWSKKLDTRRPLETTRLGFITINERDAETCGLEFLPECGGILTKENAQEIFNTSCFSMRDFIEIDKTTYLLVESWDAFHHLAMLGYSLEQFMALYDCTETIFDDSVSQCSNCGAWMHNDNGYTYNYRILDCELLGLDCGCYAEYMETNWKNRINDPKIPIELEIADKLAEQNKIKHLERFIGGMTDGRGGSYAGKSTREGNPEEILSEYQEKYPNKDFVFTHDESGQFQTYFSIWEVK